MKSFLFLLVALFCLDASAAQTSTMSAPSKKFDADISGPLHIIPVVGAATMNLRSGDGATGNDTGLSVGSLLDFGNRSLTLETGLIFNQFGGKVGETKFSFSYISLPLVAKWNVMGTQDETLYLKGGVMPSVLTGARITTPNGSVGARDIEARGVDIGALFGLGGTIPVASNMSILLDVSYLRGLVNVANKFDPEMRNEGFIFSSGLSIAL